MEQVFEMKVREKKQKLKDSETDVSAWILSISGLESPQIHPFRYVYVIIYLNVSNI